MAEIFFIASDERALDLIESLRIQSPKSLTFETDLPSAISRLPKEQPRYVFIQSDLDGIPGEEIAAQTRALVADPDLQLILLTDGAAPSPPAVFACSFSLTLPTTRLSGEVMQLLNGEVLPGAQPKAAADFSDLSDFGKLPDLFALDDQADFEIPDFDDAAFEPHLAPLWSDQAQTDSTPGKGAAPVPPADNERQNAFTEEIGFFVTEPEPPARRSPEAEPAPYVSAPPPPPANEVAQAIQIPPAMPAPPVFQEPSQAAPAPAAAQEPPQATPARRVPKSLYPTPEQIYRKPPELCGESLEGDDAAPLSRPGGSRNSRSRTGVAVLGVLVLALGVVVWQGSRPEPAPTALRSLAPTAKVSAPAAPTAPTAPAPAPAAVQAAGNLPGFVPKVPADVAYAAAHPGWELYRGDRKQFRIYREQGKIRAIQVLSEGETDLSEPMLGGYFKEATGADLPPDGETKTQNGLTIETRKARNGAEIAIYRTSDPHIVGIVLQLPDLGHK
ncbi:hypothetical protein [Geomonas anaerohicana]|uniref:Uncharacterized protein n=1 Tax=Geomonas anaerohicana TaxID=2798583 RepID=A0ABS0YF26_9BACT|nr:hypothetical protein [Geomonas anaerohicana]MBJ6750895.1 hypothetical protein [Geomonas anaerohicana]